MERKKPHPDILEQQGSVAPQVPPLLGRKFLELAFATVRKLSTPKVPSLKQNFNLAPLFS